MQKISIMIVILIGAFVLLLAIPSWLSSDKQKAEVTKQIESIEIDVAGVSTVIIPRKQTNIEAELEGKGSVTVTKSRNSIKVEYERKWPQPFSFFKQNKLTIYIPESYDRDMDIEVGSGDILVDGALQINQLSLEAGSGDVQMESVTAGKAEIDVHSGDINIKGYNGQLEADVSSGDLTIEFARLQDAVQADVSSGDLILKLPEDADFTLNGHVSSGEISNDFPLKNRVETKNEFKGVHGSGEHELNLRVSSGSIEVIH